MKTKMLVGANSARTFWAVGIGFLCLLSFMQRASYPDEYWVEGRYYFRSAIFEQTGAIVAASDTDIVYNSPYVAAKIDQELTRPNGTKEYKTECDCCYVGVHPAIVEPFGYGTWSLRADHYLGDDCGGDLYYYGSTSASLTIGQTSINYFYASPSHYLYPGSATLYWSTTNGSAASINGTAVALTGSMVVSPGTTTTYALYVSGAHNNVSATATVGVDKPLLMNGYRYSVRHEKGMSPFFPYTQVNQESVNVANGNLFYTVPLLSRPGRNGLGVDLKLAYNSKLWDFYTWNASIYATIVEDNSWVGTGWTLLVGRIIDDSANGRYYVTLSDGSNHEMSYYGGAWRSVDSTYMIYDPAAHKLTLKGGINLRFDYQDPVRTNTRFATQVQDTNGNYLEIAYASGGGRISTIQDTLGNTYTFLLNSQGRLAYISYFNTNDTTQPTSTISLEYQNQAIDFGSGAVTASMPAQEFLTRVTYIDGLRYSFVYGSSGEVSEITYPTFAKSRYFYDTILWLDRLLNETAPDHYVRYHDAGEGTATWTWQTGPCSTSPCGVSATIPGYGTIAYSIGKSGAIWADGFLTNTGVTSGSENLRRESQQDWTQDDTQLSTIQNPRIIWTQKVMTEIAAPSWQRTIRREFSYASTSDYSGNVKEIRDYDYNGTLRRKTTLNYLHEANGAYAPLNILDRVTDTLIYDGSNHLVSKTVTAYDSVSPLYAAANSIRHDASFGTTYMTRGLPSSVTRWYNIAQNLSVVSSVRYDECGNLRQAIDPRSNSTFTDYWLSSSDNAYAFPLRVTNALGHVASAAYSYKSGAVLSQTDANNKVTTLTFDSLDRVTQVTKADGGRKTYTYVVDPYYGNPPYAIVRQYQVGDTYTEERSSLDNMGRLQQSSLTDTTGGDIQKEWNYDARGALTQASAPHRYGSTAYPITYGYSVLGLQAVQFADGAGIYYGRSPEAVSVGAGDGKARDYWYQEDGKVRSVVLEEPDSAVRDLNTDYGYDTMGRLVTIIQGVQSRSFTYDNLGRLLAETHPESGTTSYSYDANSNVLSRTDARGVGTYYTYDELNRVTQKTYSDGTPSVSYQYDGQPSGSPIAIVNPVGRLTKLTRTVSGVTVSSYYSYCNCSSVTQEATVINDGTVRTYVTSYTYNLAGQLTSITYPNGKVVSYTLDTQGRQTKVSSTYNGQPFDYIYSAAYNGPGGQLTQVQYPIMYASGQRVQTLYTYSPDAGLLTHMESFQMKFDCGYDVFDRRHIQDIWDLNNLAASQHFEYDRWWRPTSYWQSNLRAGYTGTKMQFSYDRYNNITSVNPYGTPMTFNVDAATNRLQSRQVYGGGWFTFSYDAAGNMTSMGTFDAENRLTQTSQGASYMYDGNGRRFRTYDGTVVYYVYSYTGQLLTEDRITESATNNYIYFNGQNVAIHQQDDNFRLLFKDHLGSTRKVVNVPLPNPNWPYYTAWSSTESYDYQPFGGSYSSSGPTRQRFHGKERNGDLDYYGARYYDSRTMQDSSMRWISADSVTTRLYDPLSLNKYTYVRNDPVNLIDPDGRFPIFPYFGTIVIVTAPPPPPIDPITEAFVRDLQDAQPQPDATLLPWVDDGGGNGGGQRSGTVTIIPLPADNIHRLPDIDPYCGITAGGCERVDYRPDFDCAKDGDSWIASFTITLTGDIYVATGPYPYKRRPPADRSIRDTDSALRHELRHVEDLVNALRALFQGVANNVFAEEGDCKKAAADAEVSAITVAAQARADSQRRRR